jgi:hypothetical protein
MRFSELIRLLERNGFALLKKKDPSDIIQSLAMTGWFEWTIMARRKFPPAHVMLFLSPLGSKKRSRQDDRTKVLACH